MNTYKIFLIGFIGIVLINTSAAFSNEVYESSKSDQFIQQNNFTVTKVKDNLMKIEGWSSSGFVGNGNMSVHLEFGNGSKISYNDVKTLGVEYGREFVQNNDTIGPDEIGNGFVQNNNIALNGGIVDNGFVQNNNITLNGGIVDNGFATMGDETRNGFVQNNLVRGGWVSSG